LRAGERAESIAGALKRARAELQTCGSAAEEVSRGMQRKK